MKEAQEGVSNTGDRPASAEKLQVQTQGTPPQVVPSQQVLRTHDGKAVPSCAGQVWLSHLCLPSEHFLALSILGIVDLVICVFTKYLPPTVHLVTKDEDGLVAVSSFSLIFICIHIQ